MELARFGLQDEIDDADAATQYVIEQSLLGSSKQDRDASARAGRSGTGSF